MREKIHPEYHEINVVMTDGTKFTTRSTWGKPGDTMHLEVDSKSHPAWTGVFRLSDRGGQLAKFKKRFKDISIKTPVMNPTEAKPAQAKSDKPKDKAKDAKGDAKGDVKAEGKAKADKPKDAKAEGKPGAKPEAKADAKA